jgi:hypothetical protein
LHKVANRETFARGDNEIIDLAGTQDVLHGVNVVRRESPISLCVKVTQQQPLFKPLLDEGDARDFFDTNLASRNGHSWL